MYDIDENSALYRNTLYYLCSCSQCPEVIQSQNQRPLFLINGNISLISINSSNNHCQDASGFCVQNALGNDLIGLYIYISNCTNTRSVIIELIK